VAAQRGCIAIDWWPPSACQADQLPCSNQSLSYGRMNLHIKLPSFKDYATNAEVELDASHKAAVFINNHAGHHQRLAEYRG
jgi:hypothetical protein